MTFTSETPSKPGAYWWKNLPTSERCLVDVFKSQGSGSLWCRMNGSSQGTPEVLKGLWSSRLVPVDEVDKAWNEGWSQCIDAKDKSDPSEAWLKAWLTSFHNEIYRKETDD